MSNFGMACVAFFTLLSAALIVAAIAMLAGAPMLFVWGVVSGGATSAFATSIIGTMANNAIKAGGK